MRRRALFIALLIVVASLCALAVMPARWLITLLPASGLLTAVNAHGSIWSGSATLAIGQPELRRTLPEPLRWKWQLSASGPRLIATHPALGGELTLALGWSGLQLQPQTLKLPATVLGTLHAALGAIQPGGELAVSWPHTVLGLGARSAGSPLLDVRWDYASSSLTRVRPMGSYRIGLTQGQGREIDITLSTASGPLILQGQGTWTPQAQLHFEGTARADGQASPDIQAALADLLKTLGPRQGETHLLTLH